MLDLPARHDPFATAFELANPPRVHVFADGEPVEYRPTPPRTSVSPDLIDRAEQLGAECVGFFGDRRPSWQRD